MFSFNIGTLKQKGPKVLPRNLDDINKREAALSGRVEEPVAIGHSSLKSLRADLVYIGSFRKQGYLILIIRILLF